MLSYDDAVQRVLDRISVQTSVSVETFAARGMVAAVDVATQMALPPFTNSAMDGFAVRSEDTLEAARVPVTLTVVSESAAGTPSALAVAPGEAVRLSTGACLPAGADCVVPIEDVSVEADDRVVVSSCTAIGSFVRSAGADLSVGDKIVGAGDVLSATRIGLCAACGVGHIEVFRRPKVAVVTTGAELVEQAKWPLAPGQIYNSNGPMLEAAVEDAGAEVTFTASVGDDVGELSRALTLAASNADVVITCGGVSVGEHDVVRETIGMLGDIAFWRCAIRPGKPFAFGSVGGKHYFGLPGNPVSSFVTFELFVRPALMRLSGHEDVFRPTVLARLADAIEHEPGRRSFVRARCIWENGRFTVSATSRQGSHQLSTATNSNAFLVVPEDVNMLPAGAEAVVMLLDLSCFVNRLSPDK